MLVGSIAPGFTPKTLVARGICAGKVAGQDNGYFDRSPSRKDCEPVIQPREPDQIADILNACGTNVLITPLALPKTDIW